jgi:glycosyltransferase involved in cell wall biosynthesis
LLPLVVIPAYQAQGHVGKVVEALLTSRKTVTPIPKVLVVDDGSTDDTGNEAARAGAVVERHTQNRGKGAALVTGLRWAQREGFTQIVTADADGQHLTSDILRFTQLPTAPDAIVLGVRDLVHAGAPSANQFSNGLSNRFLSWFTGQQLRDTHCGLRRYPVSATLALSCKDTGYAFEAEVLIRAARAGIPIEQVPISVYYPPEKERLSHFRVVRDPYRIIIRVLATVFEAR